MEKQVNLSSFDWAQYLDTTARNLRDVVSEEFVVLVNRGGLVDCFEPVDWRKQSLSNLLQEPGSSLIIHYAVDSLEDGLVCADGIFRPFVEQGRFTANDEMAYEAAVDTVRLRLCTGEETALGYRVTRTGEVLYFQFVAIFCGTCELAPCNEPIDLDAERAFFGPDLEAFIERFVA